eukprot:1183761-Rhodomonas_salina.2
MGKQGRGGELQSRDRGPEKHVTGPALRSRGEDTESRADVNAMVQQCAQYERDISELQSHISELQARLRISEGSLNPAPQPTQNNVCGSVAPTGRDLVGDRGRDQGRGTVLDTGALEDALVATAHRFTVRLPTFALNIEYEHSEP